MQKSISISFLLIILVYLVIPMLPYVDYTLDKEFIIKNICIERELVVNNCNGKCYLNKELKQANSENDSNNNKSTPNSKTEFKQLHFILLGGYTYKYNVGKTFTIKGSSSEQYTYLKTTDILYPPEFKIL